MSKIILPVVFLALLGACTTAEERLARYKAECRSLGFSDQTEAMGQCVLQLKAIAATQAAARKNAGAILSQPSAPAYYGVPSD